MLSETFNDPRGTDPRYLFVISTVLTRFLDTFICRLVGLFFDIVGMYLICFCILGMKKNSKCS